MAIFSLTAGLTVGWSAFSFLLGSNSRLRQAVIESVNSSLPGLLRTPGQAGGLVDPDSLISEPGMSVTGIVALVVLIFTATGVVSSMIRSIRSMFGLGKSPESLPVRLLRRLLGLVILFLAILLAAVLTIVMRGAVGLIVPLVVDFLVFIVLVRWVAVVPVAMGPLLQGAGIAAVGGAILRLLGTSVVTNVSGPILATAATLVTLLLWVNLLARIALIASAWAATADTGQSRGRDPKSAPHTTQP